ncbi:hypothetical protein BTI73_06935 [Lactobacillus delbrueckii subsp. bulgaricus]|nr:hypothetical protein [Lactobacillus delbrueckii subsp. bulgaricus]
MTPEIRTLISEVIFMTKYTKEIKLAIYLNELEQAIHKYIDYYNNVRIKTGRKNMTPIEYRNHVLTTLTA